MAPANLYIFDKNYFHHRDYSNRNRSANGLPCILNTLSCSAHYDCLMKFDEENYFIELKTHDFVERLTFTPIE